MEQRIKYDSHRKHIVIVGGGFAGIAAAKELQKANVDVSIIDKSNHHLFQPLLYQVATAALSPGDIAIPIRSMFENSKNIKVVLGEVMEINPKTKSLRLVSGSTIAYDHLILAPGAKYNYFGNDEWQKYAWGLKSLSDALNMRERILLSLEAAEQTEDPALRRAHLTYLRNYRWRPNRC